MKKLNMVSDRLSMVFFFGFILAIFIGSVMVRFSDGKAEESLKDEALTLENYKSGSLAKEVDSALSGSLFFRESWTSLNIRMRLGAGATSVNGVYFLDERYADQTESLSAAGMQQSEEELGKLSVRTTTPVYLMLVPSTAGIYAADLPALSTNADQKNVILNAYEALNGTITPIDVYSVLYSARDEYVYYRNDSRWTSLGAFYAYSAATLKLGNAEASFSNYNIEYVTDGFYGDYFQTAPLYRYDADTIDVYHYRQDAGIQSVRFYREDGSSWVENDLYQPEWLDSDNWYFYYLGEPCGFLRILTNADTGKKLLVIKDSYAQNLLPFFTKDYDRIDAVDITQTTKSLQELVTLDDYDQILVVCSVKTFANDSAQWAFLVQ